MIRGTKNEGISSIAKQRHSGGALTTTGVKGQSIELNELAGTSVIFERQDEFDGHASVESEFPSNAFNGSFE